MRSWSTGGGARGYPIRGSLAGVGTRRGITRSHCGQRRFRGERPWRGSQRLPVSRGERDQLRCVRCIGGRAGSRPCVFAGLLHACSTPSHKRAPRHEQGSPRRFVNRRRGDPRALTQFTASKSGLHLLAGHVASPQHTPQCGPQISIAFARRRGRGRSACSRESGSAPAQGRSARPRSRANRAVECAAHSWGGGSCAPTRQRLGDPDRDANIHGSVLPVAGGGLSSCVADRAKA